MNSYVDISTLEKFWLAYCACAISSFFVFYFFLCTYSSVCFSLSFTYINMIDFGTAASAIVEYTLVTAFPSLYWWKVMNFYAPIFCSLTSHLLYILVYLWWLEYPSDCRDTPIHIFLGSFIVVLRTDIYIIDKTWRGDASQVSYNCIL